MNHINSSSKGFSTIELLVALFIGAAFIGVGYQLYAIVLRDGANARQQATASDLAYQILRQQSANAPPSCTTPGSTSLTPANPGLPTPFSVTVSTKCPYPTSGTTGGMITNYTVKVTYGQKEVSHAMYAANKANN